MNQLQRLIKQLGPGILFASMAIGTSHLVLSTKAGAQYGWIMILPIILANLLKYPFFEFGVRYTNVTKKSLISGYLDLGKPFLYGYGIITIVSCFTILAALYVVTAGLLINLLKLDISLNLAALLLFFAISLLLIIGRYKRLEQSLKLVVSILFIALLIVTLMAFGKGQVAPTQGFTAPTLFNEIGILFLIGLVGWMPTAVEASGWVSMWSVEKLKLKGSKISINEALREFNIGYVITSILALFFLAIGCLTLYGTNTDLSGSAVIFADQIVTLFTQYLGNWAYGLIAISALATMFSTCMTAHDALARVSLDLLEKSSTPQNRTASKYSFAFMVLGLALLNWFVIYQFSANMGNLVALATFFSFVFAPILGWMNLKTVTQPNFPKAYRPNNLLKGLSYLGIVFLSAFSLYYCYLMVF